MVLRLWNPHKKAYVLVKSSKSVLLGKIRQMYVKQILECGGWDLNPRGPDAHPPLKRAPWTWLGYPRYLFPK